MPWHPGRPVAVVGSLDAAAVRRWGLEEAVAAA